jgi:hypothetical protein
MPRTSPRVRVIRQGRGVGREDQGNEERSGRKGKGEIHN